MELTSQRGRTKSSVMYDKIAEAIRNGELPLIIEGYAKLHYNPGREFRRAMRLRGVFSFGTTKDGNNLWIHK